MGVDFLRQTAVAASVDLRCYGLTCPRDDGKLSLRLPEVDDFSHTWDINALPWESTSNVRYDGASVPTLDQTLLDAISSKALPDTLQTGQPRAKNAVIAFLYLYMSLADAVIRHVDFRITHDLVNKTDSFNLGLAVIFRHGPYNQLARVLAHPRPTRHVSLYLCCSYINGCRYQHSIDLLKMPNYRIKADELFHILQQNKSTDGHLFLKKYYTGIQVEWIIRLLYLAAQLHSREMGLGGNRGWFKFKGLSCPHALLIPFISSRIHRFKSLRFLLTDSKVSRNTKLLVEGVAKLKLRVSYSRQEHFLDQVQGFFRNRMS